MAIIHIFLIIKILSLFVISFALAFLLAPVLIHYLNKYKCWKKKPREQTFGGELTPIFTKLHGIKEVSVPRMGGILIWGTVFIVTIIAFLISLIFPESRFAKFNFLSRSDTWLPFFTLIAASLLGLVDDIMVISSKGKYIGGGMRFKVRLALIFLIALVGAWWFYSKLGWTSIYIPFYGNLYIDGLYILLFILTILATFSSGIVDGLDGLSAGVFSSDFRGIWNNRLFKRTL